MPDSTLPPAPDGQLADLLAVRRELIRFVRSALLEQGNLYAGDDKALLLQPAFDDDDWAESPLFRRADLGQTSAVVQFIAAALQRLLRDDEHDPRSDHKAHAARAEIGHDWALLALLTFQMDRGWLQTLAHGGIAHLYREYPLRFLPIRRDRTRPAPPADLGHSEPLPWLPGPLSAIWVYSAYAAALLSNETVVRRLSIPPKIADKAEGWEDYLLSLLRRKLRLALARGAALLSTLGHRLQPGDLVIADGLLTALLRWRLCSWEHILPLIRISPITRICRSHTLRALARDDARLRMELQPAPTPLAEARPELRCLAGTLALPGVQHRVAQALADACQDATPEVLWAEAAATMKLLDDQSFDRVLAHESADDEAYATGLLLVRVYSLCLRDRTLDAVVRRSRYAFASALGPGRLVDRLFQQPSPPRSGSAAALWFGEANRQLTDRLREVFDGTV